MRSRPEAASLHRFGPISMICLSSLCSLPLPGHAQAGTPCQPSPLGSTELFLRGAMNNWAASDDYSLLYRCDAYYLNVRLNGRMPFKVADEAWKAATTFGLAPGQPTPPGAPGPATPWSLTRGTDTGELLLEFSGEQTLRLAFAEGTAAPQLSIGPRSFDDPRRQPVTSPVALSLRHDSRASADKSPFGAVPAGTRMHLAISALPGVQQVHLVLERRTLSGNQDSLGYQPVARVPMQRRRGAGGREIWQASAALDQPAVWGYWFDVEIGGRHYAYQNNRDSIYWTRELGSGGSGSVEVKPDAPRAIRRFRQTVHAAGYRVPDWAADAVYYGIFPDRYRNGDPANDPKPGVDHYQDQPVEFHSRWLDKPWKPGSGDGSDTAFNNDFFGGDIAGIIDKLDDIRELGANTLYITPMFTAASNHKYDTADYKHIDPHFGSDEDFSRLTREAGKRGIRVIPDTSLNHTGSDSVYFDRYGRFPGVGAFEGGRIRSESPWAGWYRFDPGQSDPARQYTGWAGVSDLPEIDKSSRSFRDFAYGAQDSVMKTWLDRGASGWRMDVAPWVPDDFWREWRSAIKAHRPDALTIAETWFDASKFFLGDSFDGAMNYIFRNAVLDYAKGGPATTLAANLEMMREAYPAQSLHAMMNLISSHDQPRALHVLGMDDDAAVPARIALAKQRLRLAVLLQMSYPGSPAIYYGDEVGVTGGEDPYNRATYPWADRGGQPDLALRADVRRMAQMRQDHPVLRRGTLLAPLLADDATLVLARQLGRSWALVGLNNGASPRRLSLSLPPKAPQRWLDALTGEVRQARNGRLELLLPATFGSTLISQP